jgi:DNA-binding NarL/FixJ family response regulator
MGGDQLLGLLSQTMGKLDNAVDHFEDALAFGRHSGCAPLLAWSCCGYAKVLFQRQDPGDAEKATALVDQGRAIARELGIGPLIDRVVAFQQQAQLQRSVSPYPDGLTQREVEVLRLIALGKSNRQIAEGLFISLNTVERHVSNILAKTGAVNRADATGYALRNNLVS